MSCSQPHSSALHVDFYQQSFMGVALTEDTEGPSFAKFGGVFLFFFFLHFILLHLIRDQLAPLSCLKHSIPNLYDSYILTSFVTHKAYHFL